MANLICPIDTHTVYLLCNPSTTRVYYGCTVLDLEDRVRHHMQALSAGYHGNRALQAAFDLDPVGWTAHQVAKLTSEEADALETYLIQEDASCFNVQKSRKARKKAPKLDQGTVLAVEALLGRKRQYEIARFLGISAAAVSMISRRKQCLQVVA
jgi:GIY-YIG catalytic domain